MLFRFPLANPYTKKALSPLRKRIMVRYPLDLPVPERATLCFSTPLPKSASIKPFSARRTASTSASSSIFSFRAKRPNHAFLNILDVAFIRRSSLRYNTKYDITRATNYFGPARTAARRDTGRFPGFFNFMVGSRLLRERGRPRFAILPYRSPDRHPLCRQIQMENEKIETSPQGIESIDGIPSSITA